MGLVVGRGFDVEFGACFKKASFLLGLNRARGARRERVRAHGKNPFSKQVGSRPWVLACGSGQGMQKPGPNLTRCHSYLKSTLGDSSFLKKESLFNFLVWYLEFQKCHSNP